MFRVYRAAKLALLVATSFLAVASRSQAQGGDYYGAFIDGASALHFKVHVPPSYDPDAPMPLVVALHGCLMTGYGLNSMEDMSRLSELADEEGFVVAYPSQTLFRHTTQCWNFVEEEDRRRGEGEPALIAGAVGMVQQDLAIDPERIYVLGASSGAAMAVIMAVTYPDVFAAVGVGSGCEYACEPDLKDTPELMTPPEETAELAYAAMGPRAKPVPAIILQGTEDTVVPLVEAERLVTHWAHLSDLAGDGLADGDVTDQPSETFGVPGDTDRYPLLVTRYVERDAGRVLIERHIAFGLGHAWPGGGTGLFADEKDPDTSRLMWDFLSGYRMSDF